MTDERLAEWERLAAAATPEPWVRHDTGTQAGVAAGEIPQSRGYLCTGDSAKRICYMNKSVADNFPNLDFIAAARTAVPELIALVRERDAEVARLRAELAAERERAARVADEAASGDWKGLPPNDATYSPSYWEGIAEAADHIAAAIRAPSPPAGR